MFLGGTKMARRAGRPGAGEEPLGRGSPGVAVVSQRENVLRVSSLFAMIRTGRPASGASRPRPTGRSSRPSLRSPRSFLLTPAFCLLVLLRRRGGFDLDEEFGQSQARHAWQRAGVAVACSRHWNGCVPGAPGGRMRPVAVAVFGGRGTLRLAGGGFVVPLRQA